MANPATIFAAVKAVVSAFVAAYKAHWVVRAVVAVVVTIASGQIAKAFAKKPEKGQSTSIDQGLELALKLNPTQPRGVPVGVTATGGSLVWAFTSDDELTDVENERLTRIISLSDVPVNALLGVRDGDTELTFTGDWNTGFASCDQYLDTAGNPCVFVAFFPGSYTPGPVPWLIERSGGKWTEEHLGVGQAYVIVSMIYRPETFPNGEPGLVFVIEGAKIYDDRKDGSKGDRTGDHRLDNPATWEFSENTANITAQLLRGFYVNDQLLLGAQAEERDLSDYNLIAAYNTCDQDVDTLTEGVQPRYRAGFMMYSDQTTSELLNDLMGAMDGTIYDSGGQVNIQPGATHTPVMDLTDDDIVWTDQKSWQPKASLDALYNSVTGSHVGGANGFIEKSLPPLVSPDWEIEDGGERLVKEITLKAVVYDSQAQRTATRVWKSSRWQGVATFVMPLWGWELEQGDWFTLTSARWDMDEKYFEVLESVLTPDFRIAIVAKEVHPDIDGWDPAEEENPDGSDPDTPTVPGLLTPLLDVDPILLTNADSTVQIPALRVTVLNILPQGRATGVDFEFTEFDGEEPTMPFQSLGRRPPDQLTFNIDSGVMPGRKYGVRARSTDGVAFSLWSNWYTATASDTYTVPGTTDPDIDPEIVMDWLEEIDLAGADLRRRFAELVTKLWNEIEFNAEPIFNLAFAHVENKKYQDALLFIENQPVGTVVVNEQVRTDNLVIDRDLMGVRSADGLSFILNEDTLIFDEVTGETMANRFTVITSSIDDNTATIATNYTTLSNATTAVANSVTSLTATVNTNNSTLTAAIVAEQTARADADSAEATSRLALAAEFDTSVATINTQLTVITGVNNSQATSITTLTSSVAANQAAITSEATTRASADTAFTNTFTLQGSVVGGGTAFRFNGATTQVNSSGQTLANYMAGVQTSLDNNSAAIVTEQSTRISQDGVLATSISTLNTTVGGFSSSITTLQTTTNGLSARYGVAINVNGHVSGFVLNSSSTVSEFYVAANKFGVVDPTGAGGPVVPFSVTNGVAAFANPIDIGAGSSKLTIGAPAFGASSDLILWFGPNIARNLMTKLNAVFYIDNTGKAKFRGGVFGGDIVNRMQTNLESVSIGPFAAGPKGSRTVTAHYSLWAGGEVTGVGNGGVPGQIAAGNLKILRNGVNVSSNASAITGSYNNNYDAEVNKSFWEAEYSGMITYNDTTAEGVNVSFEAQVTITPGTGADFYMINLPSGATSIGENWNGAQNLMIQSVELE